MFCKELNREFADKKEMFKALKERKDEIISLKKSEVKSKNCGFAFSKPGEATKAEASEPLKVGDTVKVAMNTCNYLDYDMDLIVNGAWSKSANEQNGKTYHVINHDLKVGNVVAYPKDVTVSVERIKWSELGKSFAGETDVLVFNSKMTEKTHKDAFMAYRDNDPIEHSIRLQYVKLELALNSEDEADAEEYKMWKNYYSTIANKEVADEADYFWVVKEARIFKEGSTVLFGANEVTPRIKSEPLSESTQDENNDPPEGSQSDIYEFLIKKLKDE